jgi:O-antigen ligase
MAVFLAIPIGALFLNMGSGLVQTLGRDTTLTGRTDVWKRVLSMSVNPLLGTGFESFWLGKRLETLWQIYWFKPTEAHNGYIEVFLNLGWIGLFLLAVVLVMGYRRITGEIRRGENEAGLRLAFLFVAISYNFTEAAFKTMHPVWILLLLSIMAVPKVRLAGTRNPRTETETGKPRTFEEAPVLVGEERAEAPNRQPALPRDVSPDLRAWHSVR